MESTDDNEGLSAKETDANDATTSEEKSDDVVDKMVDESAKESSTKEAESSTEESGLKIAAVSGSEDADGDTNVIKISLVTSASVDDDDVVQVPEEDKNKDEVRGRDPATEDEISETLKNHNLAKIFKLK